MGVVLDRPFGASPGNTTGLSTLALNTQGAQVQGVLPAKQTISSTAETLLVNPLIPTLTLVIGLPPQVGLEQRVFDLVASGYIKTATTTNITLNLYVGTAIVSGNLLKSSGTVAQNSATAPFFIRARLIYDSVSGLLCGAVEFYINKTIVAQATLTNFPTGISDTADPVETFCLSITSSGATSGNPTVINLQAFSAG